MIDSSRVALTAGLAGLARAVYDYTLPYAKVRVAHGEAIGRKQAVAFKLADMHIAANAIRWMGLRAAAEPDSASPAPKRAMLTQRYFGEHALKIADEGVQLSALRLRSRLSARDVAPQRAVPLGARWSCWSARRDR